MVCMLSIYLSIKLFLLPLLYFNCYCILILEPLLGWKRDLLRECIESNPGPTWQEIKDRIERKTGEEVNLFFSAFLFKFDFNFVFINIQWSQWGLLFENFEQMLYNRISKPKISLQEIDILPYLSPVIDLPEDKEID